MITFDGFILTAFPPIAVMMILGICSLRKCFHPQSQYCLLFLAAIFLFMMAWRIPFVIDRRYVLPIIVPGIPLAILFLKTLSNKWSYKGKWLCGILLLIIAITGTAKAMRFQESKPYLTDIPTIIHHEMQEQHWEQGYVMILSNIGGYLPFNNTVTVTKIPTPYDFSIQEDYKNVFKQIDLHFKPNNLLLQYPIMYILISSNSAPEDFIRIWQDKYGYTPELCYEFTRAKNTDEKIQLFRIESPYKSAYKTHKEQLTLYQKFNLLPNPDFSHKQKLPLDDPALKQLTSLGINLGPTPENTFIPSGWKLNIASLQENADVRMKYTEQNRLSLSGKGSTITLVQTDALLTGGKIYQLYGSIIINEKPYFMINVQRASGASRNLTRLCTINWGTPGRYDFSCLIDLSNKEGMWVLDIGQAIGEVEIEYLYLVEQTVFDN